MVTIKNKKTRAKLLTPAAAIHSINVPLRKKNRGPTIACQDFQNRTISVKLFANVVCSISELPETAAGILDIWRKITNNDIRYQQRCNNLPAFLGVRDLCVSCSSVALNENDVYFGVLADYNCYPYIRLLIDNVQVAVFIIMSWCRRTGQMPLTYSVTFVNKKEQLRTTSYDLNKSNPYLFEKLIELKDVHSISFGGAAEIYCSPVDRNTDLYNIPGVRVSQKFGHQLNVYAMRHIKEIRAELQKGEFEKLRILRSNEHKKALARLEYNQRRAEYVRSAVGLSWYGHYTYRGMFGNRYERCHNKALDIVDSKRQTTKTNEALAAIHAPELLTNIVEARSIVEEIDNLSAALKAEHKLRIEAEAEANNAIEEAKRELNKSALIDGHKRFKNKNQLSEYAIGEALISLEAKQSQEVKKFTREDITKAIDTLINAAELVDIDAKSGQLVMKF